MTDQFTSAWEASCGSASRNISARSCAGIRAGDILAVPGGYDGIASRAILGAQEGATTSTAGRSAYKLGYAEVPPRNCSAVAGFGCLGISRRFRVFRRRQRPHHRDPLWPWFPRPSVSKTGRDRFSRQHAGGGDHSDRIATSSARLRDGSTPTSPGGIGTIDDVRSLDQLVQHWPATRPGSSKPKNARGDVGLLGEHDGHPPNPTGAQFETITIR